MRKDTYTIINETKKNINERYMMNNIDVNTIIKTCELSNSYYDILLNICIDSFYLGYAKGQREAINRIKRKNKIIKHKIKR